MRGSGDRGNCKRVVDDGFGGHSDCAITPQDSCVSVRDANACVWAGERPWISVTHHIWLDVSDEVCAGKLPC